MEAGKCGELSVFKPWPRSLCCAVVQDVLPLKCLF